MKDSNNEYEFPAPYLAHWATRDVPCCKKHKDDIVGLGKFIGVLVPITADNDTSKQCNNCIHETKGEKPSE